MISFLFSAALLRPGVAPSPGQGLDTAEFCVLKRNKHSAQVTFYTMAASEDPKVAFQYNITEPETGLTYATPSPDRHKLAVLCGSPLPNIVYVYNLETGQKIAAAPAIQNCQLSFCQWKENTLLSYLSRMNSEQLGDSYVCNAGTIQFTGNKPSPGPDMRTVHEDEYPYYAVSVKYDQLFRTRFSGYYSAYGGGMAAHEYPFGRFYGAATGAVSRDGRYCVLLAGMGSDSSYVAINEDHVVGEFKFPSDVGVTQVEQQGPIFLRSCYSHDGKRWVEAIHLGDTKKTIKVDGDLVVDLLR